MRPFTPFKFWVVESRNSRGGLNPPCSCFNTRNRWSSLRWHSRRASNGFDDIGLGQTEERGRWAFLWQQWDWCKRFCTQQIERNLRRDLWQWCWTFYKVFFWQWWYFCNQNDNDAVKAMKMVAIKICKPIWVSLIGTDEWRQQRVKETENIGVCLSSKDLVGHQGKKGKTHRNSLCGEKRQNLWKN